MAEIQAPNVFSSFLAGRQARAAEAQAAADQQQRALQNQFLMRDQQMQELQFQAQQDQLARQQQFNQLVGEYVGQDTVDGLAAGSGAPAQPRVSINQLYALDPARTIQLQQFQEQEAQRQRGLQQQKAKEIVTRAQYALKSESPATLLRVGFPELAAKLEEGGIDVANLDDHTVRGYAQTLIEQFAPVAGITPQELLGEQFTLGEGQARFDAQGRPIASVGPKADKDAARNERNDAFNRANTLRDEFTAANKDFGLIEAQYNNIVSTAEDPSPAGDISLIFSYMKMLDPNSTVREGEFATAQNASGVPDKVLNAYNKAIDGKLLGSQASKLRADFVKQAGNIYQSRVKQARKTRTKYTLLAKRAEVDPLDVVGADDHTAAAAASGDGWSISEE